MSSLPPEKIVELPDLRDQVRIFRNRDHAGRVRKVAREVDALYCANIREGWGFAVAEAYRRWVDLEEEEAVRLFKDYQVRFQKAPIPI